MSVTIDLCARWDTPERRAWLVALEATVDAAPADAVIHRARNTLVRCAVFGETVVAKRFQVRGNLWKRLTDRIGTGKALRTFHIAKELRLRGLATPEPIAAVEIRAQGTLAGAWYVCADQPNAGTVRDLLRPDFPDRLAHIRRFGAWAARVHDAGVLHRDFNSANVLLVTRSDGGFDHSLVDLNRIRFGAVGVAAGLYNLLQPGFFAADEVAALLDGYARARHDPLGDLDRAAYQALARLHRAHWALKKASRPLRRRVGF